MVETETENETTKEKNVPFAPKKLTDSIWRTTWSAEGGAVAVKGSTLDVKKGGIWKENQKCAKGVYQHNSMLESCVTSFLINCQAENEELEAIQLIEYENGGVTPKVWQAKCLK